MTANLPVSKQNITVLDVHVYFVKVNIIANAIEVLTTRFHKITQTMPNRRSSSLHWIRYERIIVRLLIDKLGYLKYITHLYTVNSRRWIDCEWSRPFLFLRAYLKLPSAKFREQRSRQRKWVMRLLYLGKLMNGQLFHIFGCTPPFVCLEFQTNF